MKTTILAAAFALIGASFAQAGNLNIGVDEGPNYLPSCQGTIEARSNGDQLNLELRSVEQCSNFYISVMGREYKLQGANGNRGGSFTIPAQRLFNGVNFINLDVRSDSGKHNDTVEIVVRKKPVSWLWLLLRR